MWSRHANPWSVYTRFAAIPAMIAAVWSREWFGWWALVPIAFVLAWLAINPFLFPPVDPSRGWTSKGIFGEQLWLTERERVPASLRRLLRSLIGVGLVGMVVLAWGLWRLHAWPTLYGATLIVLAQLWRIDRMGLLYDELAARRGSSEASSGDRGGG